MDKIIVADITGLHDNLSSFGHFFHVADMFLDIFKGEKKTVIAGGPIYKTRFSDCLDLPYDTDLSEFRTLKGKLFSKIKEYRNCRFLLKRSKDDYIIFQDYSNTILLLALVMSKVNSKIFLIQYKVEIGQGINKILYKFAKKKITGILCSKKENGEAYKHPYVVLPDYIYTNADLPRKKSEVNYDLGVLGIIRRGKDVVGVAKQLAGADLKLLIAGSIQDEKIRDELNLIASKNQNITLIDSYLSEMEYDEYLHDCRFIILPYTDRYYENSSSGVVYDVIFSRRPVITRNYELFHFIKEYSIGFLYDELEKFDLVSYLKHIRSDDYDVYIKSIDKYIEENKASAKRCVDFILNDNECVRKRNDII